MYVPRTRCMYMIPGAPYLSGSTTEYPDRQRGRLMTSFVVIPFDTMNDYLHHPAGRYVITG